MAGHRTILYLLLLLVLSLGVRDAAIAQEVRQPRVDENSIRQTALLLQRTIEDAIRDDGGDVQRQHVHLVLGFSTGHFGSDPLGAEAARGIAGLLTSSFLVRNDKLSVYAWEMKVWPHKPELGNPVFVPEDNSAGPEKKHLLDLFPLTPQAASTGGHDTEKAIVQITRQIEDPSDAVIVLITNSAESIKAPGHQVIGTDDPEYRQVLQYWKRQHQQNVSGASLALPFTVIPVVGNPISRSLDAVILLPAQFSGAPLTGPARAQRLQRLASGGGHRGNDSGVLFLLLVLALLAVGIALAVVKPWAARPLIFEVAERRFDLSSKDVKAGDEVCRLIGPGYTAGEGRPVTIDNAPPLCIGRFVKTHGGVKVSGDALNLLSIDDVFISGSTTITPGELRHIVFQGQYQDTMGVPHQARVEVYGRITRASRR